MEAYKSWLEQEREDHAQTEEESAEERAQLLEDLKKWPSDGNDNLEENLMYGFSNLLMKEELFSLGERIMERDSSLDRAWWLAEIVYKQYGHYYMSVRKPKEALYWYQKAIDNGLPYPQEIWGYIAGCYVELGDLENADRWIEKCMNDDKEGGKDGWLDWVRYADYFQATGRPERALALCQSVLANHKYPPQDIWFIMASAYKDLGDFDNVVAMYKAHTEIWTNDEEGYAALGLSLYELKGDVAGGEANFLKAIELVKDDKLAKLWTASMYLNLAIIHINEGIWEKGFGYLKEYYQWKFPPEEAAVFEQMLDNLPEIENMEMGHGIYQAILDFENSPLRPGSIKNTEGLVAEKPADEVKDAQAGKFDMTKLTDLDDIQSN